MKKRLFVFLMKFISTEDYNYAKSGSGRKELYQADHPNY